ncbi:efflux transporter outer membrane subunit [Caulobacter sp. S45]|uniref:efflux transporter outer membrane subunit n=1 Tax=Caulobacter sp. S45 TaxID=1641861 RepID=UPI00131B08C9|nr:efflux transporter outer membrane subunit [Caulobacter sp. S45]
MIRSANIGLLAGLAGGILLSGCAVGPHYQPPVDAAVAVRNTDPALESDTSPEPTWWRSFGDPVLDSLIERALGSNLDVRQAVARVDQARALFSSSKFELLPHITSNAGYTRSDEQIPGLTPGRVNIESADIGLDAAWEVDLFGRVRHGVDAAAREAGAAQADLDGAKVSVAAEVAMNYLQLRGAQARRNVVEQNAQSERETLKLTSLRVKEGYAEPADRESSKAQLGAVEALIPALDAQIAQAAQRLAVLTGERPGALDVELAAPVTIAPRVTPLPIGDASTFLRRRPDVRAAERRLAAETARTGVATADLFPRVTVTGFVGLLTGDVSNLFAKNSQAWTVSPAVTWPALDIGSQLAQLRAQKAKGHESQLAYEKTVLGAIEDLQDALTNYKLRQTELSKLVEEVDGARKAADLARMRYQAGGSDYLRVLDAERVQLQGEDALTQAQTASNTDIVAIYKALGGGWS